jgi:hypothetical protein
VETHKAYGKTFVVLEDGEVCDKDVIVLRGDTLRKAKWLYKASLAYGYSKNRTYTMAFSMLKRETGMLYHECAAYLDCVVALNCLG